MADVNYLSSSGIKELEDEIDGLTGLVKTANIDLNIGSDDESDDDDEFACKICLTLVEGVMHACTICELLMCDDCKTRHCQRKTRYIQCPGCGVDFVEGLNPMRSRIVENMVKQILEEGRK